MFTERANRDFVQSAAPNGNDDKSCLWRGLPRFRNYENMKMTALSVTPGAACFDEPMTDFPQGGIQNPRAKSKHGRISCILLELKVAISEPIFPLETV